MQNICKEAILQRLISIKKTNFSRRTIVGVIFFNQKVRFIFYRNQKEGNLLSCIHIWSPGTVCLFFIGTCFKLLWVGSDCVGVAACEPTLNLLALLLIFNNRLLLILQVVVIIWVCLFSALVHFIVDALVWESDRWGGSVDGVVAFNFATLFTRKSRYLLVTIVVCHLQLLTAKLN